MSLPVVLRSEAEDDVEQVRNYLDSQRSGFGEVFLTRLREVLFAISVMPEMHRVIWNGVRATLVRKFKYLVYYRVHKDFVQIIAVLHGSRDESIWKQRAK